MTERVRMTLRALRTLRRPIGLVAMLCACASATAAPDAASVEWSVGMSGERWQLPLGETMGVAGLHLRRGFGQHLRLGVDSFAAVQGQRGGFITLGVGGELRYPLGRALDLEAGVSVSAGGGRGGHELSGGGLLLRESVGLTGPLGPFRWRGGISRVDFPNGGTIAGTQWYAGLERGFAGLALDQGREDGPLRLPTDVRFLPSVVGAYVRQYRVRPGSLTDGGTAQPDFGVVGAEWRAVLSGPWYASFDAGGAARGQSNGYMEILGGVGMRLPLSRALSVDAGVSVGAGGGGAVDTGGGLLVATRLGAEWLIGGRDAIALGVERMKAPGGHLTVDGVSLSLRRHFGPMQPTQVASGTELTPDLHHLRVRIAEQTYRAASAAWSTRPIPSIGVMGVQVDYDLTDLWYLTGQGLAAYRGQSGAYMTGLVGAGVHAPLAHGWQLEAEALAGAAGGGGVAVASGAIGQVNAGVGYEGAGGLGVHATLGKIRSLHGGFSANVIGVSVSYRTTLLTGPQR